MSVASTVSDVSVRVKLPRFKYWKALHYGEKRALSYRGDNKQGLDYGTPRGGKSIEQVHKEGAVGEMLVCEYIGEPFDKRVIDGGDEGHDLALGGKSLDVKVSSHPEPDLLVKTSKIDKADIYVLVRLNTDGEEPPDNGGLIVGYEYSEELKEYEPGRYYTDIRNYRLDWKALKDPRELLQIK